MSVSVAHSCVCDPLYSAAAAIKAAEEEAAAIKTLEEAAAVNPTEEEVAAHTQTAEEEAAAWAELAYRTAELSESNPPNASPNTST